MSHEARLEAVREIYTNELLVKKNTELNQANETISKLHQKVVVQKRLMKEANRQLRESETSLFALQ